MFRYLPLLLLASPAFALDSGVSLDAEYIGDVAGISAIVLMFGLGFVSGSIR